MNELSLFSGGGGGLLASHLLGWNTIGYVEFNDYAQRIIAARIADGYLPNAPIFGDIRAFLDQGYAASYTGMVDVVSGGFPCQPFSVAGKQAGADDARNMWPATIECIRLIRPRYAFLENVPGLVTSGYFGTILGDLAESGFDCRWRILSAAELGAPHKRDRLWIVADAHGRQQGRGQRSEWGQNQRDPHFAGNGTQREMAHASGQRLAQWESQRQDSRQKFPSIVGTSRASGKWWATEPDLGRVAHGVAHRVDRLKALGNGQVPAVAAAAFRLLE